MSHEIKKYLYDIKEAIDSIESYLGAKRDFNEYLRNKMLRRAVEREFEIIGEAVNSVDKIACDIQISGKKQIIGMRNRIIHGYDKVDDDVVWGVIIKYMSVLRQEVQDMLDDE